MRRATAVLSAGLALAACNDPPTVPPDIIVQVMEPVVWAGTDWVLRSPGFALLGATPTITLDDTTVMATVVNESTITVRAPDVGGIHTLHVHTSTQVLEGVVEVAGYLGSRTTLPLGGWPLPIAPGSPVMIAATESTLVRVNAATGVGVPLAIPHHRDCAISPGPSYRPGTVIAATTGTAGCPSLAWSLGGTPTNDSGPVVSGARLVAELSPGTWLRTTKLYVTTMKDGATVFDHNMGEAERVVFSPDRSRVVVLTWSSGALLGAPVLDAVLGTVAFVLPFRESDAAVYVPTGDTLFASGGLTSAGTRLVALTAAGDVLIDSAVTNGHIFDLVLDPSGPSLYGLVLTTAWEPMIRVFDRRTLATVAELTTTPACGNPCNGQWALALDAVARRLHVLIAANFYGYHGTTFPTTILDYSVPPVAQAPLALEP